MNIAGLVLLVVFVVLIVGRFKRVPGWAMFAAYVYVVTWFLVSTGLDLSQRWWPLAGADLALGWIFGVNLLAWVFKAAVRRERERLAPYVLAVLLERHQQR